MNSPPFMTQVNSTSIKSKVVKGSQRRSTGSHERSQGVKISLKVIRWTILIFRKIQILRK